MGMSTERVRFWSPPSHAMEQGSHSVHGARTQLRSQDPELQACSSSAVSHSVPPFLGFVRMARDLPCVPPPHSLEHEDQPDHSDMWQLIGQWNWLHFMPLELFLRSNSSGGHAMPKL